MDLNDIYQSLASFWDKISPILISHLVALLALRWMVGTRLNVYARLKAYLASDKYTRWKEVFDEFQLRPKLPYLIVIAFLIYLTLFNSLLLDSLSFRPLSIVYSELDFWEENRPLDQLVEIASYTNNPNIRFWEIALEKQKFVEAFRVRYPEQFRSSVSWLVSAHGKWLTWYKCAILFLILIPAAGAISAYKKKMLSKRTVRAIFVIVVLSILVIGFTRYKAEQYIEKQLHAELAVVSSLLHVDPDAQKNQLTDLQKEVVRKRLCAELSTRESRSDRPFWWSRVLESYLPFSVREFGAVSDVAFRQRYCPDYDVRPSSHGYGCPPGELSTTISQISATIKANVGVAFAIPETNDFVSVEFNRRFPMESVFKLPLALFVLQQIERGELSFEQNVRIDPKDFVSSGDYSIRKQYPGGGELSVRELLRFMIVESDGTACDVLLRLVGGPQKLTQFLREMAIEDMVISNYEKDLLANASLASANWTTPDAMIALLKLLVDGRTLSESSRAVLLDMMKNSRPGSNRIKRGVPAGTNVAHKTGTGSPASGLVSTVNDVGIVQLPDGRHLLIAIYISDAKVKLENSEEVIAKLTEAAWKCWVTK
jgi:beta-lactamase class A